MMGKSWKFSKGHSSGFVPDYRHAVETTGESEGFGRSIQTDMDRTVSGDPYAPKRKSVNLNGDGYESFGVPMQVLSLSLLSRSEKKNLEFKLKQELEQVRILQRKIDHLASDAVVLSPSSEVRSYSDVQKKPPVATFNKLSNAPAHSKKKGSAKRNGPQAKRSVPGSFLQAKPTALTSTSNAMLMKQCETLLNRLMSHQFGWVFNEPVDFVKLNIPDYPTVIKNPMDLGTIKSKVVSGEYSSPLDFAGHIRLTFSNAMTYNPVNNEVHMMADTLRKFFEVRWKAIEKKLQLTREAETKPSVLHLETEIITPTPPLKKKKIAPPDTVIEKSEPVKPLISGEEKDKLGLELQELLGELPESIIDFLKEHSQGQGEEGEIEIDIDALSDDTLLSLRKLLDGYLLEKHKNREKAEPCEIELHNESGFSNCSVQPSKGNEPVDEDIDIVGGNNPPATSFPPVEIEKDAAHRNSKPGSPSSSSSGSGSSSSDSDSSSESESDSPKPSVRPSIPKENITKTASPDLVRKRSDNRDDSEVANLGDSGIGNPSVTEVAQAEQDSMLKPTSDGVDDQQEGESAPPERPVSPEKQYRAALLRNRFADTILKAREKALEKAEKRDPEKLQREKEELEKRQKEEKARLQAEATAAEEARKKAEQQVAAEARRKRELEREAARQALQMMEKTVEINENSQFMEDLEMLRTAPDDEELPNFEEEASPEVSQNGLGSFKLQGNNPLEKLGLYMKMDDDFEEEEAVPAEEKAPEQPKDVEEGEID